MAILLKVQWVDQSDQPDLFQRVRHIGGDTGQMHWQHSQAQAIESIERGLFTYYLEKDSKVLTLNIARTSDGRKYLSADDGQLPLLNLPQFPPAAGPMPG